jgi:hypothetical protein
MGPDDCKSIPASGAGEMLASEADNLAALSATANPPQDKMRR